ncbi:MAG: glycosyltransferase [Bacteroidota bacterium]|jgi:glycosyltransferase involved in cell wall biosynthesis
MRLLFICTEFPPNHNAIGEYVNHLSYQLLEMGNEIHILTGYNCFDNHSAEHIIYHNSLDELSPIINKINVYAIVKSWDNTLKSYFTQIMQLLKPNLICLQYEPYSFHSKGIPFYLLKVFNKSVAAPLIVTFHEVYARNYLSGNPLNYLIAIFQVTIAQKLAKRSIVSFTALDLYMNAIKSNKKICKLFIGSNIPISQTVDKIEYSDLNIKKNTIICFGNKDYIPILLAVEHLTKKMSISVSLAIVGNISEKNRNYINNEINRLELNDCVDVFGYCNDLEVENIFKECNFFIDTNYLDSKKRGGTTLKSGSLATAYKYNKLVLGFQGDMTDELLVHAKNIWFCENSSPMSIATAVEYLLKNDHVSKQIKQNAIQFYEQHLNWEVISKKYFSNILKHLEN